MKLHHTSRTRRIAAGLIAGVIASLALGAGILADGVAQATTVSPATALAAATAPVKVTATSATRPAVKVALKQRTQIKTAAATASASGQTSTKSGRTATYKAAGSGELSEARSILAGLVAKYPILAGTTVTFGDAKGYQAISYYKSGRIVISATHRASLSRILNHEVWHIIDWRDNGRIDWGENVPPSN